MCGSILTGPEGCIIHYLYLALFFKGFKIAYKKCYETKLKYNKVQKPGFREK